MAILIDKKISYRYNFDIRNMWFSDAIIFQLYDVCLCWQVYSKTDLLQYVGKLCLHCTSYTVFVLGETCFQQRCGCNVFHFCTGQDYRILRTSQNTSIKTKMKKTVIHLQTLRTTAPCCTHHDCLCCSRLQFVYISSSKVDQLSFPLRKCFKINKPALPQTQLLSRCEKTSIFSNIMWVETEGSLHCSQQKYDWCVTELSVNLL